MHYQKCEPFLQQFECRTLTLQRNTNRLPLLLDGLTDLKDRIRDVNVQAVSQELQDLIGRVIVEIESWLNLGEEPMPFEAQMTLSNIANGPTAGKSNIGNQFSFKV